MNLKEVLLQVPGAQRRFVYYLESQGYIQPKKVPKLRIARRDYSERDLQVIRETWRYYRRGFSLQAAYELGVQRERVICYVGFWTPKDRITEVVTRLQEVPEVVEVAAVYGDTMNILVKTSTGQVSDLYTALSPVLAQEGVTGMPGVWHLSDRFERRGKGKGKGGKSGMMAYLLMKVPGKGVHEFLDALKMMPEMREIGTVYGESDVIARVETADQEALDELVMKRLHGLAAVETTRTYIVISKMHWARDGK